MILVLCSIEEDVNDTLYKKDLSVRNSSDVLFNIFDYLDKEIESIIITKKFIDGFGLNVILSALKTLSVLKPISVIYITYSEEQDMFLNEIHKINIPAHPLHTELRNLSLDNYYKVLNTKYEITNDLFDMNVFGDSIDIINKYIELDDFNKAEFLNMNASKIFEILQVTILLLSENDKLINAQKLNSSLINTYKLQYENMSDILAKTLNKNNELKDKVIRWQNMFNSLSDEVNNINTTYNLRYFTDVKGSCKVIYFKELEDINFFRYFDYLYNYFRQLGVYCKALILDEREHMSKIYKDYTRIPDRISKKDLLKINKILRNSDAKKLIDMITSENFKCELLLVYDKTRHSMPLIADIPTFFLGYNNNYDMGFINDSNFISPIEGNWKDINSVLYHINYPMSNNAFNLLSNNLTLTHFLRDIYEDNVEVEDEIKEEQI